MTYISVMVGEELKRWREKLEMTQAELAKRLKVDVMTVSNWERDKRRIPEFLDLALREIERENK
jgi:transcriptional regulator with XRE-family HTH domain